MPVKCTRCQTRTGQVTLAKRALKCYRAKHPNCSADDLFCNKCNDTMEAIVARTVAKQKKKKLLEHRRRISLEGVQSTTGSSSFTISTVVEQVVEERPPVLCNTTPNTSGVQRSTNRQEEDLLTSPEIQYTQTQSQPTLRHDIPYESTQKSSQSDVANNNQQGVEPVRHEYEEDVSDDDQPLCSIAGPRTAAAVTQPIVRKRKTAVVFADERIIPIYNQRRDFGG